LILGAGVVFAQIADQGSWEPITTSGAVPPNPDAYHTTAAVGSLLYVAGGKENSSVFTLNTANMLWSDYGNSSQVEISYPVVQISGGVLYLFGGNVASGPVNSMRVFFPSDVNPNWTTAPTDTLINARNGHTLTGFGTSFFVFGGWNLKDTYFDTMWMIDTSELQRGRQSTWVQNPSKGPHGRNQHTTVEFMGNLFIFGGFYHNATHDPSVNCSLPVHDCRLYNDLWRYNTATSTWTALNPTGVKPKAKFNHMAVVMEDKMIVWGGMFSDAKANFNFTSETHIYSFTENHWTELSPVATPPLGRLCGAKIGRYLYAWGTGKTESTVWRFNLPHAKDVVEPCGVFSVTHLGTALGFNLFFTIVLFIITLWRFKQAYANNAVNDYSNI